MKRTRTIRSRTPNVGQVFNLPGRFGQVKNLPHKGFTLVEMLVSVTLVLLMMVMFGEIFQVASSSVTKQRALADNDQHARTFVTVMRADLDKRTFRSVIPFFPGELAAQQWTPFGNRKGYFYISCNNPENSADDVLQFTVSSSVKHRNSDESPYYGHATQLFSPGITSASPRTQQIRNFLVEANQPDRDDGQIVPNEAGSSPCAEVCYFMRGDKLYRRVMLMREAIKSARVDSDHPAEPQTVDVAMKRDRKYFEPVASPPFSLPAGALYPIAANFWGDFDYSAHRLPTALVAAPVTAPHAVFNGSDYLPNGAPDIAPWAASMGQTWNRFGFNHEILANANNGLPREFSASSGGFFIGRFLHAETSHPAFLYPQRPSTAFAAPGNVMDTVNVLTDVAPNDGVVDQFARGTREGEDLLLTHVHEFRVEAWDERLGQFVTFGRANAGGDFDVQRQLNRGYAPNGGMASNFDTWHPVFDRDFAGGLGNRNGANFQPDDPPFRPLSFYPGDWYPTPMGAGVPWNAVTTSVAPTANAWQPDTQYSIGQVVFEPPNDANMNNTIEPSEKLIRNIQLPANSHLFVYRCVGRADRNLVPPAANPFSGALPPGFPLSHLAVFSDNEVSWQCEYNPRPLRVIRITVRFQHPTSRQMRQVTIVHSLRDTTGVQ